MTAQRFIAGSLGAAGAPDFFSVLALLLISTFAPVLAADEHGAEVAILYETHCSSCHGADRLGVTGPALLPQTLERLDREKAKQSITEGLPATQMPAFGQQLEVEQIEALVDHIYTPLEKTPRWERSDIVESRLVHVEDIEALSSEPQFEADPENLFLVVETGTHHATVLDGDRFEPIHRFKTRYALHGGPKYSPDGRYVFLASRDGWITRFDIYNLTVTHEIRVGINTRNLALSGDGRFVLVGNYLPHTLVVLDADNLELLATIPVTDRTGENSSRVSAVYQAAPRNSFIAALRDVPEIWEIFYDPEHTPPSAETLVKTSDGASLALRRIGVEDPMVDFLFEPGYQRLIGAARDAGRTLVVDLEEGRVTDTLPIGGMPHLASGITWMHEGRRVMATPHLREAKVSVVDMTTWKVIAQIETKGPGFFLRSHENSRYAWIDVFFGPHRDVMHVIDKETLELAATLTPEPGKTAAHVEFTRDGSHALVSIWEMDGAVVVYDAQSLEEVKRLPMKKPSGKYNVSNKIYRSPGTSH